VLGEIELARFGTEGVLAGLAADRLRSSTRRSMASVGSVSRSGWLSRRALSSATIRAVE
jgi:hypothetical protein